MVMQSGLRPLYLLGPRRGMLRGWHFKVDLSLGHVLERPLCELGRGHAQGLLRDKLLRWFVALRMRVATVPVLALFRTT